MNEQTQGGESPQLTAGRVIAIAGDIHGDSQLLNSALQKAVAAGAVALIQAGDFGVYPFTLEHLMAVAASSPIPVYFIDGNHEHYPIIKSWPSTECKTIAPNLTYVPRGVVLEIAGLRVGFLGGAGSIDYAYRKAGRDWFPNDEQIADASVDALIAAGPVDILITHTPPRSTVDKFFDISPARARASRRLFGAAPDWTDPSADKVQRAWEALGRPPLYCGHMHRAVEDYPVRILNIGEIATVTRDELRAERA